VDNRLVRQQGADWCIALQRMPKTGGTSLMPSTNEAFARFKIDTLWPRRSGVATFFNASLPVRQGRHAATDGGDS